MATKSSLVRTVVLPRHVDGQALVDLVAAHPAQVVALRVEEDPVQRRARRLDVGRLAGTEERVDGVERVLLGLGGVLLDGVLDQRALAAQRLPVALVDLDLLDPQTLEDAQDLLVDLVGLLDQHLAGLGIHELLGDDLARAARSGPWRRSCPAWPRPRRRRAGRCRRRPSSPRARSSAVAGNFFFLSMWT